MMDDATLDVIMVWIAIAIIACAIYLVITDPSKQ